MLYLTPDLMRAYECADEDERKRMLRAILEAWDAEYQYLINCGVSPETIWDIGARQLGEIIGTDGADEYN